MANRQDGNSNDKRNEKQQQMDQFKHQNTGKGKKLTTDSGMKVSNDRWSLRAGKRGPTLLQDFHFYKKQSHFNRERIPEKVVHARGDGAYGEFELYTSLKGITRAKFLQKEGKKTPVFVRFSNFIGSKGSKDTAVDIRGFATKFYTEEGNYDMLALSFAVFSIMDAMKFADFVHAVKPNPQTDVPQATIAHNNAWDYITSNEEIAHFIMWLMSDRGRPRSWRMMEAWPVNTFRFVNEEGKGTFVRFVWKPLLGVHSLLLDEANVIGGVDPDYHRRDLHEAIKKGAYPQYELGIQLIDEKDEFSYDFDILDDTKLWPEEEVPVKIVGKLTLNRLVDNHFAEEEQVSFDPSTVVPGIDFSNDPVLQGRTFAYRDTDYHRLGTGNINDIPINRPVAKVNYNERDSYSRYRIDVDAVNYHENHLAHNTPAETPVGEGGYSHAHEKVEGEVTRERPGPSFSDYYSQARLFWNSMSAGEKERIIETFVFHLGYVDDSQVRQRVVNMFANVDTNMAQQIASQIGVAKPTKEHVPQSKKSPVLSLQNTVFLPNTLKVGMLVTNGFDEKELERTIEAFKRHEVFFEVVSDKMGDVYSANGKALHVDKPFISTAPELVDALYVVGGTGTISPQFSQSVMQFVNNAYSHYKPIGVAATGEQYIHATPANNLAGVVYETKEKNFSEAFIRAIAQRRFWNRT